MTNYKNYILYLIDKLLKKPNINNGFIEAQPKLEDYIHPQDNLGGNVEKKVLIDNGDWTKYVPKGEKQNRNGNETMSCVSQSAMNAIEIIINYYLYLVNQKKANEEQEKIINIFKIFELIKNGEANFSDRYIAKLSGTTYRGNSQDKVADAIRHYGLIPEDDWTWVDGWDEYYKDIPLNIINKGLELLKYIEINYEWVSPRLFTNALKYAPIQTSLFAWNGNSEGIYYKVNNALNHSVVNDGFNLDKYYVIFDSYENFEKLVSWDFNFGWGMLYSIHLKKQPEFNAQKIKELENRGLKYIMRAEANGEIYEIAQGKLNYISPTEILPIGIKSLKEAKKIIGITEDLYKILTNQ